MAGFGGGGVTAHLSHQRGGASAQRLTEAWACPLALSLGKDPGPEGPPHPGETVTWAKERAEPHSEDRAVQTRCRASTCTLECAQAGAPRAHVCTRAHAQHHPELRPCPARCVQGTLGAGAQSRTREPLRAVDQAGGEVSQWSNSSAPHGRGARRAVCGLEEGPSLPMQASVFTGAPPAFNGVSLLPDSGVAPAPRMKQPPGNSRWFRDHSPSLPASASFRLTGSLLAAGSERRKDSSSSSHLPSRRPGGTKGLEA